MRTETKYLFELLSFTRLHVSLEETFTTNARFLRFLLDNRWCIIGRFVKIGDLLSIIAMWTSEFVQKIESSSFSFNRFGTHRAIYLLLKWLRYCLLLNLLLRRWVVLCLNCTVMVWLVHLIAWHAYASVTRWPIYFRILLLLLLSLEFLLKLISLNFFTSELLVHRRAIFTRWHVFLNIIQEVLLRSWLQVLIFPQDFESLHGRDRSKWSLLIYSGRLQGTISSIWKVLRHLIPSRILFINDLRWRCQSGLARCQKLLTRTRRVSHGKGGVLLIDLLTFMKVGHLQHICFLWI